MADWDVRFMELAHLTGSWSKDPNEKVGCLLVRDKNVLAGGFNGFPRGIVDDARLFDRDVKLQLIVHAEANSVASAALHGHSVKGATAYITRPPCTQCAALLIQAGITKVIHLPSKPDSKWAANHADAHAMLIEANIIVLEKVYGT